MSILFFIIFIGVVFGDAPVTITNEYLVIWALFSIADALWFRGERKR